MNTNIYVLLGETPSTSVTWWISAEPVKKSEKSCL